MSWTTSWMDRHSARPCARGRCVASRLNGGCSLEDFLLALRLYAASESGPAEGLWQGAGALCLLWRVPELRRAVATSAVLSLTCCKSSSCCRLSVPDPGGR